MLVPVPRNPSGESVLGSNFTLSAANGTYQDTGLSVTLPGSGTYLIFGGVRGGLKISAGDGFLCSKLYNATDGADVANSERFVFYTDQLGTLLANTSGFAVLVTVAAAKTIKLYAKRDGTGTTWVTSLVAGDVNGRTNLGYVRLMP